MSRCLGGGVDKMNVFIKQAQYEYNTVLWFRSAYSTRRLPDEHSICQQRNRSHTLHVEYAKRRRKYGILFIVACFVNMLTLNMCGLLSHTGVDQAEYIIHVLVAASQE